MKFLLLIVSLSLSSVSSIPELRAEVVHVPAKATAKDCLSPLAQARALVMSVDTTPADFLVGARSPHVEVRLSAVQNGVSLNQIREDPTIARTLIGLLRDENADVRDAARRTLGNLDFQISESLNEISSISLSTLKETRPSVKTIERLEPELLAALRPSTAPIELEVSEFLALHEQLSSRGIQDTGELSRLVENMASHEPYIHLEAQSILAAARLRMPVSERYQRATLPLAKLLLASDFPRREGAMDILAIHLNLPQSEAHILARPPVAKSPTVSVVKTMATWGGNSERTGHGAYLMYQLAEMSQEPDAVAALIKVLQQRPLDGEEANRFARMLLLDMTYNRPSSAGRWRDYTQLLTAIQFDEPSMRSVLRQLEKRALDSGLNGAHEIAVTLRKEAIERMGYDPSTLAFNADESARSLAIIQQSKQIVSSTTALPDARSVALQRLFTQVEQAPESFSDTEQWLLEKFRTRKSQVDVLQTAEIIPPGFIAQSGDLQEELLDLVRPSYFSPWQHPRNEPALDATILEKLGEAALQSPALAEQLIPRLLAIALENPVHGNLITNSFRKITSNERLSGQAEKVLFRISKSHPDVKVRAIAREYSDLKREILPYFKSKKQFLANVCPGFLASQPTLAGGAIGRLMCKPMLARHQKRLWESLGRLPLRQRQDLIVNLGWQAEYMTSFYRQESMTTEYAERLLQQLKSTFGNSVREEILPKIVNRTVGSTLHRQDLVAIGRLNSEMRKELVLVLGQETKSSNPLRRDAAASLLTEIGVASVDAVDGALIGPLKTISVSSETAREGLQAIRAAHPGFQSTFDYFFERL